MRRIRAPYPCAEATRVSGQSVDFTKYYTVQRAGQKSACARGMSTTRASPARGWELASLAAGQRGGPSLAAGPAADTADAQSGGGDDTLLLRSHSSSS